jgi:hypothetical protein
MSGYDDSYDHDEERERRERETVIEKIDSRQ